MVVSVNFMREGKSVEFRSLMGSSLFGLNSFLRFLYNVSLFQRSKGLVFKMKKANSLVICMTLLCLVWWMSLFIVGMLPGILE